MYPLNGWINTSEHTARGKRPSAGVRGWLSPGTRRGISLIEVLISIGVLAIGLLGVSALIPVAGHQAQEGIRNARMAETGRRAFRELQAEGLLRQSTWAYVDSQGVVTPQDANTPITTAVCLDPRIYEFLRPTSNPFFLVSNPPVPGLPVIPYRTLYLRNVDELFISQDELGFEITDRSKAPPMSQLLKDPTMGPQDPQAPLKRYTVGRYSWMVFLAPEAAMSASNNAAFHGRYDVSVVVFEDRQKYEENVPILVKRFDGLGGGTLELKGPLPAGFNPDLYKTGNWILLVGSMPTPTSGTMVDYRWYRIRSVDWARNPVLSVQGPDWRMQPPLGVPQFGAARPAMWAVFVPRVVNVYTKTMRLEM